MGSFVEKGVINPSSGLISGSLQCGVSVRSNTPYTIRRLPP